MKLSCLGLNLKEIMQEQEISYIKIVNLSLELKHAKIATEPYIVRLRLNITIAQVAGICASKHCMN